MKKLILSTLAIIFALGIYANDNKKGNKTPEEKATKQADKMKTELGLSDEQRTMFYNASLERIKSVQTIRDNYKDSANKKGMNKEVKAVNETFDKSLASFLTADQMTKYNELQAAKKTEIKDKRKSKGKKGQSKKGGSDLDDED